MDDLLSIIWTLDYSKKSELDSFLNYFPRTAGKHFNDLWMLEMVSFSICCVVVCNAFIGCDTSKSVRLFAYSACMQTNSSEYSTANVCSSFVYFYFASYNIMCKV